MASDCITDVILWVNGSTVLNAIASARITFYHRQSRWIESGSPMNVQTITADTCYSMGDALRDIDAKNLIRSDFILMYGDVVSNIKLKNTVEEHK